MKWFLYEDDLHDNGQVTLTCKIRVMPTVVFCLERLWVRVDGVMLRVRDTRVSLEFVSGKVYRDVVVASVFVGRFGESMVCQPIFDRGVRKREA